MASPATIMAEMRTAIAALATSRDAAVFFKPHQTNDPFEDSALAGYDGFEVTASPEFNFTSAFGVSEQREIDADFIVRVGHSPFHADEARENIRRYDIEKIADILENRTWLTGGVQAVWFRPPAPVDKSDPNWWITTLTFRVVYTGAKISS